MCTQSYYEYSTAGDPGDIVFIINGTTYVPYIYKTNLVINEQYVYLKKITLRIRSFFIAVEISSHVHFTFTGRSIDNERAPSVHDNLRRRKARCLRSSSSMLLHLVTWPSNFRATKCRLSQFHCNDTNSVIARLSCTVCLIVYLTIILSNHLFNCNYCKLMRCNTSNYKRVRSFYGKCGFLKFEFFAFPNMLQCKTTIVLELRQSLRYLSDVQSVSLLGLSAKIKV
ncbi:hypothetical protein QTP88_007326 [Uroleucon formosanum]